MNQSLYGPSPTFLKAVRWVSRVLYLFMGIAVIAAVTYATGERNDKEKALEKNRQLERQIEELNVPAAYGFDSEPDRVAGFVSDSQTQAEVARLTRELDRLRRECVRLRASADEEHARAEEALVSADVATAKLRLLERELEVVKGEIEAQRMSAAAATVEVSPESDMQENLTTALQTLIEDPDNISKRLVFIDSLKPLDHNVATAWLGRQEGKLPLTAMLAVIEGVRADGMDALVAHAYAQNDDSETGGGAFLDALRGYSTPIANDLRLDIADAASRNDPAVRVRAVCDMALAGDKRAKGFVHLLYRNIAAGDPLRLQLIRLPGACGSADFAAAAEDALIDPLAQAGEKAAARESFLKLGRSGYVRLKEVYDTREIRNLDNDQIRAVKEALDALEQAMGDES